MLLFLAIFGACRRDDLISEEEEEIIDMTDYADWTEETHGENATLNYGVVFNQNAVLRYDIKIASSD